MSYQLSLFAQDLGPGPSCNQMVAARPGSGVKTFIRLARKVKVDQDVRGTYTSVAYRHTCVNGELLRHLEKKGIWVYGKPRKRKI